MPCQITGTYYSGQGFPIQGAAVTAQPLQAPVQTLLDGSGTLPAQPPLQLFQGGQWVVSTSPWVSTLTDASGNWSITLPWSLSETLPSSLLWRISFPDGTGFYGSVPDQVSGATLFQLTQSYNWLPAEAGASLPPAATGLAALGTVVYPGPSAVATTSTLGAVVLDLAPVGNPVAVTRAANGTVQTTGSLKITAPNGFANPLLDLQVNGLSLWQVDQTGALVAGTIPAARLTGSLPLAQVAVPGGTVDNSLLYISGGSPVWGSPVNAAIGGAMPNTGAAANYGRLSVGAGPFDGSSTGHFVGSSAGTALAINAATGYTGNLCDFQLAGSSKFLIDSFGNTLVGNGLQVQGATFAALAGAAISGASAANYALLSVGQAPWDGTATGHFVGSTSGTMIGANALSGYLGALADFQVAGARQAMLDHNGWLFVATNNAAINTASVANAGRLSIAGGAWDGTTTGHFAGSSAGTHLAINAATGFSGNLADFQLAGASKFLVDNLGNAILAGSVSFDVVAKAANYSIVSGDSVILVTASTKTITLPNAASFKGFLYTVKNGAAVTGTTVASGGGTIDGATTDTSLSTAFAVARYISDGTNWYKA